MERPRSFNDRVLVLAKAFAALRTLRDNAIGQTMRDFAERHAGECLWALGVAQYEDIVAVRPESVTDTIEHEAVKDVARKLLAPTTIRFEAATGRIVFDTWGPLDGIVLHEKGRAKLVFAAPRKIDDVRLSVRKLTENEPIPVVTCTQSFSVATDGAKIIAMNGFCRSFPTGGHAVMRVAYVTKDGMNDASSLAFVDLGDISPQEGLPWLGLIG